MMTQGARVSPLTSIPGWHISLNRGELMHSGPLGAMQDTIGSALEELCLEGVWDGQDLSPWEFRRQVQLNCAFEDFVFWSQSANQQHTLKRFTRLQFCMRTASGSFPCLKGKAHNSLVLCRWLDSVCSAFKNKSSYCRLRWQILWAWVAMFDICLSSDPDFLTPAEAKQFDDATGILLHGSKVLARLCASDSVARWKLRPKLHTIWHINQDVQNSMRNPRAWWTFKDEETMGKLSTIARATHPSSMNVRSLERWCVQFFEYMEVDV